MGTQSTAKTIFLLTSMLGWLAIGGALIYLGPELYYLFSHSDRATLWLSNLMAGGYNPRLGTIICAVLLPIEILGNWFWYTQIEKKIPTLNNFK